MITAAIRNPDLFQIKENQTIFYGCDQEWYTTKWQRLSGCGPTTVSSIMHYLNHSRSGLGNPPFSRQECLSLMEDVWKYVTPTMRGISSTKLLYKRVLNYAHAKKLNLQLDVLDIPKSSRRRPEFHELLNFLKEALDDDSPVAFLNLNNGDEALLDSWHWVTIISLGYPEDGNAANIEILDEGIIKKIDLAKWFRTTTLGGGFVRFRMN